MPAFAPTDIMDLWAWYDANVGVTGGTSVTAWEDQSGLGNDLASLSGEEPSQINNVINGLPVIIKGGGNKKLSSAVNVPDLSTDGGTIFIVGQQSISGDSNGPYLTFGTTQSVNIRRQGATANANRFTVNSSGGSTNNDRSGVTDGVFHTLRLRVDNVNQYASVNNDTETSVACILGSYAGGSPLQIFFDGSATYGSKLIAEILIYNRDLSAPEITMVEDYLKDKYQHY